jgi:uncharacterized protein (TIGR03437 family)
MISVETSSVVTSMAEDPGLRLVIGGQTGRSIVHLIPMERPEITSILHADLTAVTQARPARKGETLILVATGLGPTRPGAG